MNKFDMIRKALELEDFTDTDIVRVLQGGIPCEHCFCERECIDTDNLCSTILFRAMSQEVET